MHGPGRALIQIPLIHSFETSEKSTFSTLRPIRDDHKECRVKHVPAVEQNTNAHRILVRKFEGIGTNLKNLGSDERIILKRIVNE